MKYKLKVVVSRTLPAISDIIDTWYNDGFISQKQIDRLMLWEKRLNECNDEDGKKGLENP